MALVLREKALGFLRERRSAFLLTFRPLLPAWFLRWRKGPAYRSLFGLRQPAHLIVLRDLAHFCRAAESCVVPENRDKTLVLEGRREVFLRISQHLNLNPDQLLAIYGGGAPQDKDTSQ